MRINQVKHTLAAGGCVAGTMVGEFRSPELGPLLHYAGFDFLIIDNEHSPYSLETDLELIRLARRTPICSFVRVPDAAYHLIARTLDAGAEGVMVPRVETRETVEGVVAAVKYPPQGRRGCGARAILTEREGLPLPDLLAHINANTLVIIQVESERAVRDIDELASVPGVDVLLVGPNDLSISLRVPGEHNQPKMVEAIGAVIDGAARHGVAAGIHLGAPAALRVWKERGLRFLLCSSDEAMLLHTATQMAGELRQIMGR